MNPHRRRRPIRFLPRGVQVALGVLAASLMLVACDILFPPIPTVDVELTVIGQRESPADAAFVAVRTDLRGWRTLASEFAGHYAFSVVDHDGSADPYDLAVVCSSHDATFGTLFHTTAEEVTSFTMSCTHAAGEPGDELLEPQPHDTIATLNITGLDGGDQNGYIYFNGTPLVFTHNVSDVWIPYNGMATVFGVRSTGGTELGDLPDPAGMNSFYVRTINSTVVLDIDFDAAGVEGSRVASPVDDAEVVFTGADTDTVTGEARILFPRETAPLLSLSPTLVGADWVMPYMGVPASLLSASSHEPPMHGFTALAETDDLFRGIQAFASEAGQQTYAFASEPFGAFEATTGAAPEVSWDAYPAASAYAFRLANGAQVWRIAVSPGALDDPGASAFTLALPSSELEALEGFAPEWRLEPGVDSVVAARAYTSASTAPLAELLAGSLAKVDGSTAISAGRMALALAP